MEKKPEPNMVGGCYWKGEEFATVQSPGAMAMIALSKNGIVLVELANATKTTTLGKRRPWLSSCEPTRLASRLRDS